MSDLAAAPGPGVHHARPTTTGNDQGESEMTTTVEVGQVWADNDKRSEGRKVRVIRVEGDFAFVQPAAGRRGAPGSGRITRIRLDRFRPTSTGYRLVSGASGDAR